LIHILALCGADCKKKFSSSLDLLEEQAVRAAVC